MTSPVAKLIRLMVETGVAPELIEQTVEAFAEMFSSRKSMDVTVTERDESMDDRVTRIREKDRIRQRARRERERESMDSSVDVRGLSMDERDSRTATLVPQVKNLSSFSKVSKILKKEEERKKEEESPCHVTSMDERDTAPFNSDDWEYFWDLFPNKVGKGAAFKAFAKALRRTSPEVLFQGLRRYVNKTDERPWCNPATWLNQDRWLDQPATVETDQQKNKREMREIFDALDRPSQSGGDENFGLLSFPQRLR